MSEERRELRSSRRAWRTTFPVCGYKLSAVGQRRAVNSGGNGPPSLASYQEALGGERLLDDYAERGI